jgi:chaperonin GroES
MIRPLGDRVVLKPVERVEKTKGGIVLPDTAKEKPMEAEVVAVGEGRVLDNGTKVIPTVKVGERVVYSKYAGSEVKLDDQDYLIISEKDILGIIE